MNTQLELFPNYPRVINPADYHRRLRVYYRSSRWKEIRQRTLERANFVCQAQKSPSCEGVANQVHHTSYSFWQRTGDVPGVSCIAICGRCHCWIWAHPKMLPDPANDNELRLEESA